MEQLSLCWMVQKHIKSNFIRWWRLFFGAIIVYVLHCPLLECLYLETPSSSSYSMMFFYSYDKIDDCETKSFVVQWIGYASFCSFNDFDLCFDKYIWTFKFFFSGNEVKDVYEYCLIHWTTWRSFSRTMALTMPPSAIAILKICSCNMYSALAQMILVTKQIPFLLVPG